MSRLRVVWAGLLLATGFYAFVAVALMPADPGDPQQVIPILGLVALSCALASLILGRRLHAAAVDRLDGGGIAVEDRPDPTAPGTHFRDPGPRQRLPRDPEAARAAAVNLYFRPMIVSCALADSVGVMGVVVALLGGPPPMAFGLIGAGAVLMAVLVPTGDRVFGPVEQKLGISLRDPSPPR